MENEDNLTEVDNSTTETNQEISVTNQEIPVTNQEIQVTNQEIPVTNQEIPVTNQEIPVTNQEIPVTNQEIPVTNQEIPVTNQEIPVTNQVETGPTKEEKLFFQFDGVRYTALTEKEAEPIIQDEKDKPLKTVFVMTRTDATKCFTLKVDDGSKPEQNKSMLANVRDIFSFGKKPQVTTGGKLKTKKRRITKKRNQKKGFKSRSKK